jgi:hypothetical protein
MVFWIAAELKLLFWLSAHCEVGKPIRTSNNKRYNLQTPVHKRLTPNRPPQPPHNPPQTTDAWYLQSAVPLYQFHSTAAVLPTDLTQQR